MARLIDIIDVACLKYSIRRKGYKVTIEPKLGAGLLGRTNYIWKEVLVRPGLTYRDTAVILRHEYTHVLGEPLVHQNQDEVEMGKRIKDTVQCGSYWLTKPELEEVRKNLKGVLTK